MPIEYAKPYIPLFQERLGPITFGALTTQHCESPAKILWSRSEGYLLQIFDHFVIDPKELAAIQQRIDELNKLSPTN